jgi:hypothetical protein
MGKLENPWRVCPSYAILLYDAATVHKCSAHGHSILDRPAGGSDLLFNVSSFLNVILTVNSTYAY